LGGDDLAHLWKSMRGTRGRQVWKRGREAGRGGGREGGVVVGGSLRRLDAEGPS
jgi:hypothetical protein